MKQIVLYGVGNSGKSTTLRKFYEKFIRDNREFTIIDEKFIDRSIDYDMKVIFRDLRIAIVSHGDSLYWVQRGMDYAHDCDIVICVTRSKGDGYHYLYDNPNPQIWIEKSRFDNVKSAIDPSECEQIRNEIAEKTADRIYQLLELLVSKSKTV